MAHGDALRLQRGLVMHALRGQYPHPMTQVTLERQVSHMVVPGAELEAIVAYLVDKGWMRIHRGQIGPAHVVTYQLTADGVDIADGSTVDVGVELGLR